MKYIAVLIALQLIFPQEKTVTLTEDVFFWTHKYILKYNDSTKLLTFVQKNLKVLSEDQWPEYQRKLDRHLALPVYREHRAYARALIDSLPFDSLKIKEQIEVFKDFRTGLKEHLKGIRDACDWYVRRLQGYIYRHRFRELLIANAVVKKGEKISLLYKKGELTINKKEVDPSEYKALLTKIFPKFNETERFQMRF